MQAKARNAPNKSGKSFLSWVGGKSLLAPKLLPLAPPHTCYVEVFAGAAWMLFKKPSDWQGCDTEVINDINVDLVTLYRVVQHHLEEFVRYFKWTLVSREEFERLKRVDPSTLTDIQRAARFFYIVKTAFGSRIVNPTFGTGTVSMPRFNLLRLEEDLSAAHLRLSRVAVENLPWRELIDRYDRAHTWFYLDPPYYGVEDYYGKKIFPREDFQALADRLAGVKGKWLMSINDVKPIRDIFKGFEIDSVSTTYSMGAAKRATKVSELVIANYSLKR